MHQGQLRYGFGLLVGLALPGMASAAVSDLFVVTHPVNNDYVARLNGATGASINSTFINLSSATGITVGNDGNLYVGTADPGSSNPLGSVYRYNAATGAAIGSGPFVVYNGQPPTPDSRDVINPQGMHFGPDGNLYIADAGGNQTVHLYSPSGSSVNSLDPLATPTSLAFDHDLNLFVATSNGVMKYNSALQTFSTFVQASSSLPNNPIDVAFSSSNNDVYVLDAGGNTPSVLRYKPDGSPDGATAGDPTFAVFPGVFQPAAMTFGPDGELYVSGEDLIDSTGDVLRFHASGTFHDIFASGLDNPGFLAFATVPEPATLSVFLLLPGLLRRRNRRS